MSDLEVEEASKASLVRNSNNQPASARNSYYNNKYNTGSAQNRVSHANVAGADRKLSQDSVNNREFNDIFNQLGDSYTTKKHPDMYSNRQGPRNNYNGPMDDDLIDMSSETGADHVRVPYRGGNPQAQAGNAARRPSPVNSDHPSDLTDGTWNSRAGLTGKVKSIDIQNISILTLF